MILEQTGHQGDTQFYLIDKLPEGAKKTSKQFIAASEQTGHVHALTGDYDMYECVIEKEKAFAIDVKEDCILNHTSYDQLDNNWDQPVVLPDKDHNPSTISKGFYIVGIQNRFDPLKMRKERVKD